MHPKVFQRLELFKVAYCKNKIIHIVKKYFRWADVPILEHKTFSLKLTLKTYDNEVYCN